MTYVDKRYLERFHLEGSKTILIVVLFFFDDESTVDTKIKHPRYNIRMYWTNFCQPTVRVQQNIFEETLIGVGTLQIYTSFGTFCVQIGQLFESQWAFEECLNIDKLLFPKMLPISTSCEFSETRGGSNNRPIWTQKVPKEA